jgi:hypothetical protein
VSSVELTPGVGITTLRRGDDTVVGSHGPVVWSFVGRVSALRLGDGVAGGECCCPLLRVPDLPWFDLCFFDFC